MYIIHHTEQVWQIGTRNLGTVSSRCIFDRQSRHGAWRTRGGYGDNADEDETGPEDGAKSKAFAAKEIAEDDGYHGIHVSVGADLGRRFMMDQPDVGGEGDERAGDNQVEQR